MKVKVSIVSAFTANSSGGNKAGVVLDADTLSPVQKQKIAALAGFSETAFVSSSNLADFKLEFFTPLKQIAHCGHATIASFALLKQLGKVKDRTFSSKETVDGIREIKFINDEVYMEQRPPVFSYPDREGEEAILDSLGVLPGSAGKVTFVSTGNTFMVLDIASEAALKELNPDFEKISKISSAYNLAGYYVFCKGSNPHIDATSRMFAPAYGIEEEAATGMAAGPLAAYLFTTGIKKACYTIEQGRYMKPSSPSIINVQVEVKDEVITSLFAGGGATVADLKVIDL